jgi:inorganic pyrophosphatase
MQQLHLVQFRSNEHDERQAGRDGQKRYGQGSGGVRLGRGWLRFAGQGQSEGRFGPMTNYVKLPTWADRIHIHAVVETPRGSRAKLEFDSKLQAFTLSKPLLVGLTYPYDWGFVPGTKADDGDPLDVLLIHDAATYPGLVLKCRPIGVLEVMQSSKKKEERNDRLFAVPDRSPFEGYLQDIRHLPKHAIAELERFFEATDALETKKLKFLGWHGPQRAIKAIKKVSQ